jgi:Domain of unknown function (DUF4352)
MSSYPNFPTYHPPTQANNGLGTAGFVLGLIGAIFSLIPIIGVVAWFLVIPGLVLASIGFARTRKGEATNTGLAIAGIVLSLIGLLFCILYAAAFATAVSDTASGKVATSPGNPSGESYPFGTVAKSGDVSVSVSAPAKFTPSSSAAAIGGPIRRAVVVNISITNNGTEPYQFNPFIVGPNATAGGAVAPAITDLESGAGIADSATILPGKSYTYKMAFSVPEQQGEFQVELSSSIFGSSVVFAGTS